MHALVLALALIASEQSYGPYTRPTHGADAAVAPARGGALLAWSEAGRIRVGMLDAHARLGEKVSTLPATSARATAIAPAAASNGTAFFVAWIELGVGGERVLAMPAGVDGTPLGVPRQYGQVVPVGSNEFALRVVWDGAAYRLWASGKTFTVGVDGAVLASTDVTARPQGVAAANGIIGTSAWRSTLHCSFSFWCTRGTDLVWSAGTASGSLRVASTTAVRAIPPLPVLSPSTMAAVNGRFAVAWAYPNGVSYLVTGDGNHYVPAVPETSLRPGLACDDAQCMIAYGQSGDVHAFTFPIDRLTAPQLLTIAASERAERAPQVYLLGPERYLAIYRSDGADGARMNWRIISFGSSRRRAVR